MELPGNVTFIGNVERNCKIYVEDYVLSFMKQMNREAQDRSATIALFGKNKEEADASYHFVYGACKMESLSREARHLSQAQLQEIEKLRKKYFADLEFIGYRILNGEMIEGLHICEQGICRYIGGFAGFYEKNDAMLNYMLEIRDTTHREAFVPEQVDQTKYIELKKRKEQQKEEWQTQADSEKKETAGWMSSLRMPHLQKMQLTAAGLFAVICLLGIAGFRPKQEEVTESDKLYVEEGLSQALLQENSLMPTVQTANAGVAVEKTVMEETMEGISGGEAAPVEKAFADEVSGVKSSAEKATEEKVSAEQLPEATQKQLEEQLSEPVQANVNRKQEPVAYVIQPGDTLLAICLRQYGSSSKVKEICKQNNIANPDNIQEGQIIVLP